MTIPGGGHQQQSQQLHCNTLCNTMS
jgi:hypothetical protein